jgi:hypothetical protein
VKPFGGNLRKAVASQFFIVGSPNRPATRPFAIFSRFPFGGFATVRSRNIKLARQRNVHGRPPVAKQPRCAALSALTLLALSALHVACLLIASELQFSLACAAIHPSQCLIFFYQIFALLPSL